LLSAGCRRRRRISRIRPLGLFRFQNLFFLKLMNIFGQLVGLLGRGISPTQGLYLHRTTQHRKTRTHIHSSIRIRTRDPSVRAAEDSTCLRPLGHWDWLGRMYEGYCGEINKSRPLWTQRFVIKLDWINSWQVLKQSSWAATKPNLPKNTWKLEVKHAKN
jgi:hypothetical protein